MSGPKGGRRELLSKEVRAQIIVLAKKRVSQEEIARIVGVSQSSVSRIAPAAFDDPLPKATETTIVRMLAARVAKDKIAEHFNLSIGRVDRIAWAAKGDGALPEDLKCSRDAKPEDVPAASTEDVLWSYARRLAAARKIKAKFCFDHIADDLCHMPSPKVSPRDVLVFAGRLEAAL